MEIQTKQVLREVTVKFPPSSFYSAGEFFRTLHKQIKAEIKQYSYRQLSVDLGFSPTNLVHLIVQGKRPVTEKAAQKIVDSLDLKREERRYFLALAQLTRDKSKEQAAKTFAEALSIRHGMMAYRVQDEESAYFSEWYHSIVREMVLLENFQADPQWIAEHIQPAITPHEAEESLRLLERLKLIQKDPLSGRYVQREQVLSSGAEVDAQLVDKYHRDSIQHGLRALQSFDSDQRHVSALVLGLTPSQLERVRQEIEVFQQKLFEIERNRGDDQPNNIVRLNVQLFPSVSF